MLDALEEAITIGRQAGIPVEIWHLKAAGRNNWGRMKEIVARIERARSEGVDISANMYPYEAARNGLVANVPEWAQAGGTDAMLARFHDPAQRARIKSGLWHGGLGAEVPEGILLVSALNPELKKYMGKRLGEAAREMRKPPDDALLDLVEADRGNVSVVRFVMNEEDVQLGLRQPWVALGVDEPGEATDGGAGAPARLWLRSAAARALCAGPEVVPGRGSGAQDDLAACPPDAAVGPRRPAPWHGGRRDGVRSRDRERPRHVRAAAALRRRDRVRGGEREGRARRGPSHLRAAGAGADAAVVAAADGVGNVT